MKAGDVKPPRAQNRPSRRIDQLARRRMTSPADMEAYLEAEGFKKLCFFGGGLGGRGVGRGRESPDLWCGLRPL